MRIRHFPAVLVSGFLWLGLVTSRSSFLPRLPRHRRRHSDEFPVLPMSKRSSCYVCRVGYGVKVRHGPIKVKSTTTGQTCWRIRDYRSQNMFLLCNGLTKFYERRWIPSHRFPLGKLFASVQIAPAPYALHRLGRKGGSPSQTS
jgi:hypothetical protein